MKKNLYVATSATLFFIALVLLFSVSIRSNAHPGRTDGNGGHTDRSTGEYHYHHGYPAHQHYDIDGDGVIDCPYLFKDKTGSNSGGSGSSNNGGSAGIKTEYNTVVKEVIPSWVYWVIAIMACSTVIMLFKIRSNDKK